MFKSLGQYDKAEEYLQKALVISTEIGHRKGEATNYGDLGTVFQLLGQYKNAKKHFQRALTISTEISDKQGEAADLANLGFVSRTVGDYEASEVCLVKALSISRNIRDRRSEFQILRECAILYLLQNKIRDSLSCLQLCIEKYEELRHLLGANDVFKTSFLEASGIFPYKLLCGLLCVTRKIRDALYVEALSRARGLSDLMAEKYSVQTHISADPQSWFDIEHIFRKENNCTCLYISYFHDHLRLWILKTNGGLPDSATEQLMSRFYEHLIEGRSASDSLHQAMKCMRKNCLNKMSEWASFTLIGDDVRLEFDKQRQDSARTGIS